MKVAVIGSGVSGLTAAHLLCAEHHVVVFESATRPGGHANTRLVTDSAGTEHWVDTGFIVLNERNYPSFEGLLAELGVATRPSAMGLSIAMPDGSFEFAGTAKGLFAQRSNLARPRFLRMLRDQLRFNRDARAMIGRVDGPSVGEFVRDMGYSDWFMERVVMPEVSAVWSSDPAAVWDFPVAFLAEFLGNHGQLEVLGRPRWRTVVGGSRTYVNAIAGKLGERLRLGAAVQRIERLAEGGVAVEALGAGAEVFDEVVIAAHSDQALAMLGAPTEPEREVLGAMRYERNEAALHTDPSLMPKRKAAWASWNFHLTGGAELPTMSYWMNRLQGLDAAEDIFVTLNRTDSLDPDKVIDVIPYEHPIVTHEAVAAQRRWGEVSGADRIHYCGAYWRWGFHEDGCWSAIRACAPLLGAGPVPLVAQVFVDTPANGDASSESRSKVEAAA
ncbi:MAG: FAD-dependent oxidoreductase [Actinomycetota bacterium]|nr:FAD-dependent oxidoreductase [Actinomycetota bacterium]